MKKCLAPVAAGLLLCLAAVVQADTITAAGDPYPPFGDPKNPTGGLAVEILRAAYQTQGHKITMEFVPWARAEAGVKNGTYDIVPYTWRTDARLKVLLFSTPYAIGNVRFMKRKGDPFDFIGLDSLTGKVVGTVRGYGYGDAFVNASNFTREPSNDLMTNVKKLLRKRVDLTLEDEIVARALLSTEDPQALEQIEFVKTPLSVNPLYVTAGLQNPKAQDIIAAFNKGLEVIRSNGTLDRIFKRYGMEKANQ
jgi:polar amino acid transport system substrate-binding protein